VDEITIKHIKGLYADGKSMREIKDITGVSYPTIYKYTTLERKQREREEDDDLNDDLEPEPEDDGMHNEDNY
jgi:transposase